MGALSDLVSVLIDLDVGAFYDAPRNQDQIRKYLRWNQDTAAYPCWKDSYRMFGVS